MKRKAPIVEIETRHISDWETFHTVFAEIFGFPGFYGRNMDAWIDCMSSLDDPKAGLSVVTCTPGHVVTLQLKDALDFAERCPEQFESLVECVAYVNWRRLEGGEPTVLALSYNLDE